MSRDALELWPFLADIKLPENMRWFSFADDPAIVNIKADDFVGFITTKEGSGGTLSFKEIGVGYTHHEGINATLQDLCIALANFAWTQP